MRYWSWMTCCGGGVGERWALGMGGVGERWALGMGAVGGLGVDIEAVSRKLATGAESRLYIVDPRLYYNKAKVLLLQGSLEPRRVKYQVSRCSDLGEKNAAYLSILRVFRV